MSTTREPPPRMLKKDSQAWKESSNRPKWRKASRRHANHDGPEDTPQQPQQQVRRGRCSSLLSQPVKSVRNLENTGYPPKKRIGSGTSSRVRACLDEVRDWLSGRGLSPPPGLPGRRLFEHQKRQRHACSFWSANERSQGAAGRRRLSKDWPHPRSLARQNASRQQKVILYDAVRLEQAQILVLGVAVGHAGQVIADDPLGPLAG